MGASDPGPPACLAERGLVGQIVRHVGESGAGGIEHRQQAVLGLVARQIVRRSRDRRRAVEFEQVVADRVDALANGHAQQIDELAGQRPAGGLLDARPDAAAEERGHGDVDGLAQPGTVQHGIARRVARRAEHVTVDTAGAPGRRLRQAASPAAPASPSAATARRAPPVRRSLHPPCADRRGSAPATARNTTHRAGPSTDRHLERLGRHERQRPISFLSRSSTADATCRAKPARNQ